MFLWVAYFSVSSQCVYCTPKTNVVIEFESVFESGLSVYTGLPFFSNKYGIARKLHLHHLHVHLRVKLVLYHEIMA